GAGARRQRPRPGEAPQLRAAVLPLEDVPGRELPDLAEDRERGRDRVEREERLDRVRVERALRQRVELRRERELVARDAVVERLDAEAVACEHERSLTRVPDGDCEHAAQALCEVEPPLL